MNEFSLRPLEDLAHDWPPQLDHISASSLNMALRCEEQWRQTYVLGKRQPPRLAMLNGKANHAAIERNFKQKIDSHVDLPIKDIEDMYLDHLEAEAAMYKLKDLGATQTEFDDLRKLGPKAAAAYHVMIAPRVQPTVVEEAFEIEVDVAPVKIVGRMDVIAAVKDFEKPVIIERKTGKRSPRKPNPDWVLQGGIYQLVRPMPVHFHLSNESGTTRVPGSTTDPLAIPPDRLEATKTTLGHIVNKIGFLYQRYGPDEPWPATGKMHAWACGYCGYREECWAWT